MPPTTSPGSFKNIAPPEKWIRFGTLLSSSPFLSFGKLGGKPWQTLEVSTDASFHHRCQAFNLLVKELLPFSQAKRSELKSPEVVSWNFGFGWLGGARKLGISGLYQQGIPHLISRLYITNLLTIDPNFLGHPSGGGGNGLGGNGWIPSTW